MFRNSFQGGLLTVFYAGGSNPLKIWEVKKESGYIQCFLDQDIKAMVVEIGGTNVSTTFIRCPMGNVVFGITLPFLVMIVKNLKKYFTFEVTILDDTNVRRRFRVANFQSTTKVLPLCTAMPICLADGWNQIQFNLADFTQRAYGRQYMETQTLKINANIRIRRIYFTEKLVPEDELPADYKLYFPIAGKKGSRNGKVPSQQQMEVKAEPPSLSMEIIPPQPEPVLQPEPELEVAKSERALTELADQIEEQCTCEEEPRPKCICGDKQEISKVSSKESVKLGAKRSSVRPSKTSIGTSRDDVTAVRTQSLVRTASTAADMTSIATSRDDVTAVRTQSVVRRASTAADMTSANEPAAEGPPAEVAVEQPPEGATD